jgi:hypothetical protein
MQLQTEIPAGGEAQVRQGVPVLRALAAALAAAGVLLLAFGFWATHTGATPFGDAFIPTASGALGAIVLIAGVLADMLAERLRRKAPR